MRGSKTDCGGRWYSFHGMIPIDEDMQYNVVDVRSYFAIDSNPSVFNVEILAVIIPTK